MLMEMWRSLLSATADLGYQLRSQLLKLNIFKLRMNGIGVELETVADVGNILEVKREYNANYLVLDMFHPRLRRNLQDIDRTGPITRTDKLFSFKDWNTSFVGRISPWLELDCANSVLRMSYQGSFHEELSWASHLNLRSVMLPPPVAPFINYARCVAQYCERGVNPNMKLLIPILASSTGHFRSCASTTNDSWQIWNQISSQLGCFRQVGVILLLDKSSLEQFSSNERSLSRWISEPLYAVSIHTNSFIMNDSNYPVLEKSHQKLIQLLLLHSISISLRGKSRHESRSMLPYVQYLRFLQNKAEKSLSIEQQFSKSFWDVLQNPLQPLADNLESQTYETFEQDPVKYVKYELAIIAALEHTIASSKIDSHVVVMVVGAGRGPLVAATISAADKAAVVVKIYAIEKNPHAVITLRNRSKSEQWQNKVCVVAEDIRHWKAPELADIVVSELLGSFGDNELSPECLDFAMTYMKRNGINIPKNYSSYVSPISCSVLWQHVKSINPNENNVKSLESPYVVRLSRFCSLAPPQKCWEFKHPDLEKNDNKRYVCLEFLAEISACVHGFSGYFESELFENVQLSIVPSTHTTDMISWFPFFFPLNTPITVSAGQQIIFHLWRCHEDTRVWYEWCVTSPITTKIHNSFGKSYSINL